MSQNIPGPRTYPTVKPLATMNKRNLKYWELRIGVLQAVVLAGLVMGSIVCAFFLGIYSGEKSGFDRAMVSAIANVPRLPVALEDRDLHSSEGLMGDVYAKLDEEMGTKLEVEAHDEIDGARAKPVPELGSIKDIKEAPIGEALKPKVTDDLPGDAVMHKENEAAEQKSADDIVVKLLGGKNRGTGTEASSPQETLGKLVEADKAGAGTQPKPAEELETKPVEQQATTTIAKAASGMVVQPDAGIAVAVPAVEPQRPSVEAPKPVENNRAVVVPKGWFAQVAAPRKRSDADDLAGKLRSSGFKVAIETANVRGEEYYRVLVGPEDNRALAERLVSQLGRERYISGQPFIRLVK